MTRALRGLAVRLSHTPACTGASKPKESNMSDRIKTPQVAALPGTSPLGLPTRKSLVKKTRRNKGDKAIDLRVERAYYATCSGIQVDVMDIGKIFAFGRLKVLAGEDDAALGASLRAYVETLRKN